MRFIAQTAPNRVTLLPIIGVAPLPALLVAALVSMSLSRAEEFVRLPTGAARPPAVRESPVISLRLSRRGTVTIGGQAVTSDGRTVWQRECAAVRLLGFEPAEATVAVSAEPDVPTGMVQRLMEQARQAGFQKYVLR